MLGDGLGEGFGEMLLPGETDLSIGDLIGAFFGLFNIGEDLLNKSGLCFNWLDFTVSLGDILYSSSLAPVFLS